LAAREKECGECEAPAIDRDEDGYCSICKLKPLEERFSLYFRAWVENLRRLYVWRNAGYRIPNEMLDFEQWEALAVISRYHQVKDAEAQIASQRPA
jgi:hypothetical protein